MLFTLALFAAIASLATARNIYIQVGGNMTAGDNTTTFSPQRVAAVAGDIVFFNFSAGNHSATQSTFAVPCIPAHDTNITINGFDSGFRDTDNGTVVTIQSVPITPQNENTTFWFYDASPGACGSGAVGVINSNENGNETLAGFVRNAERLNGTDASDASSSASGSATGASGSASASSSATSTDESSSAISALPGVGVLAPLAALVFGFGLVLF
ncbi:hypothetical protein M0805_004968 [Coniferiporia weirii]|nr:hypothetical protein M0805_004968 [Coniferiporia weirii]